MREELKPCPFCTGVAEIVIDEDGDGRFAAVACQTCGAGSRQHYFCGDDAISGPIPTPDEVEDA